MLNFQVESIVANWTIISNWDTKVCSIKVNICVTAGLTAHVFILLTKNHYPFLSLKKYWDK